MGKLGNLAFFHSVMTEMEDTRNNLTKLKQARLDNEQRNTMNDLKIKGAELDLETKRAEGKADKFEAQIMEKIFGDQKKKDKADFDVADNMIEAEGTKQKNRMKGLIGAMGQGINQAQADGEDGVGASLPGFDVSFDKKFESGLRVQSRKPKTETEKFKQGFINAEASENKPEAFKELGRIFPGKRKVIQEQRILGLHKRSRDLLGQIKKVQDQEVKDALKKGKKPRLPVETAAEFLEELIDNRAEAEKAGHDVDEILDILGVTEQEILDNQSEPKKGFLDKLKFISPTLKVLLNKG